ncbi:MAG: YaiO family outer membrane beta-barrel protein [Ignavibacteriaceae bacterium]|jgi:YaiO family outer membrane protein|nr:YaiO family outer membrane beta-barrel protein [Ignavibacteriaceae bacterium]
MPKTIRYFQIPLLLLFLFQFDSLAQKEPTSDELFLQARTAAFDKKDYIKARALCKEALSKSPNYTDIEIFLGRLYTWDQLRDSARIVLTNALAKNPTSVDAHNALIDLEYWSGDSPKALAYANSALTLNPVSEEILLKKTKILVDLQNYEEAYRTIDTLLHINRSNTEAFVYAERIKDLTRINTIGTNYDYEHFSKVFDPWHSVAVSYSRKTAIGSVIGRINYANRFLKDGMQFEIDAYPRFMDGFYSYVNFGYSGSTIFPKLRFGLSLYYSLPLSFEIDAGIRYLKFPSSKTDIYTFALGKYYSAFWFSFRTFIIPSGNSASYSYTLITRYYLTDADNYLAFSLGTGISPDERSLNNPNLLISKKIGADYNFRISKRQTLSLTTGYIYEEYFANLFRNKISFGVGTQFSF